MTDEYPQKFDQEDEEEEEEDDYDNELMEQEEVDHNHLMALRQ